MNEVVMPRLSDTMEEGTVLHWLKRNGEHVRRGEPLVEIETDKAAMIYESDREGVLQTIASEGDTLSVGEPIARIAKPGEGASKTASTQGTPNGVADDGLTEAPPAVTPNTPTGGERRDALAGSANPMSAPVVDRPGERIKASPLARRIAHETGVDLSTLRGSGPGGRIVRADVQATSESPPSAAPAAASPSLTAAAPSAPLQPKQPVPPTVTPSTTPSSPSGAGAKGETTPVELSRTQQTIARRMAESKATIPDFNLTVDVDMERCVELRTELKRLAQKGVDRLAADDEKGSVAPTYNDMIVKACALALREYPRANGSYRDGRFELYARVNVGVAVAVGSDSPTDAALVVPTIFDADTKALGEIARETRTLAQRVRAGTVTPPELSGGTFTVSNLGMYGIKSFSAIVNPPQAAILAVGAVEQRAVIRDQELVAAHMMSLTLACDHRILYGADAALFLARVRELLQEPAALTL